MKTIRDVAKLANVSVATVSRVLNEPEKVAPATQERVRAVMAELNFIPNLNARSLATSKSGVIGVLVNNVSGGYYGQIIDSIETEARQIQPRLSGKLYAGSLYEPLPLWILQPSYQGMRLQPRTGTTLPEPHLRTAVRPYRHTDRDRSRAI